MFQRRPKRFRRRSNGRGPMSHGGSDKRIRPISFINSHPRNNFKNSQSAEKLFEKYNALAKEALSSGDKTLSENYLQHADHFMRIIDERNKNQNRNLDKDNNKAIETNKQTSENSTNELQKTNEDKK